MSASQPASGAVPLVRFDGLNKRFGATQAVYNETLAVRGGRTLALLGESAVGKSTLCKLLAGICAADSGEIYFDGQQQIAWCSDQRRQPGVFIHQDVGFVECITVAKNVRKDGEPKTVFDLDNGHFNEYKKDLGDIDLTPKLVVSRRRCPPWARGAAAG